MEKGKSRIIEVNYWFTINAMTLFQLGLEEKKIRLKGEAGQIYPTSGFGLINKSLAIEEINGGQVRIKRTIRLDGELLRLEYVPRTVEVKILCGEEILGEITTEASVRPHSMTKDDAAFGYTTEESQGKHGMMYYAFDRDQILPVKPKKD